MTKEEIDAKYTQNCAALGDIEMKIERNREATGQLEIQKQKFMVDNKNLNHEMNLLLKEEAKAAKEVKIPEVLPAEPMFGNA